MLDELLPPIRIRFSKNKLSTQDLHHGRAQICRDHHHLDFHY